MDFLCPQRDCFQSKDFFGFIEWCPPGQGLQIFIWLILCFYTEHYGASTSTNQTVLFSLKDGSRRTIFILTDFKTLIFVL
jgi:hypothetical protein